MYFKLFCIYAFGFAAGLGCAPQRKSGTGSQAAADSGTPQVKHVLSPRFHHDHISRVAIVSTKFKENPSPNHSAQIQPVRPEGRDPYGMPAPYQSSSTLAEAARRRAFFVMDGPVPYQNTEGRYRANPKPSMDGEVSDNESRASAIEDVFIRFLIGKGYSYASRKEVREIMLEQAFQHSGLTDSDAVKMGKLLNVPAVIVISVSNLGQVDTFDGNPVDAARGLIAFPFQLAGALLMPHSGSNCLMRCSMTARLISTQTGEVLWLASLDDIRIRQRNNEVTPVLQKTTELIARCFPSRT